MLAQLSKKIVNRVSGKTFARGWSLWPPFVAAGIRVEDISNDFRFIKVSMKMGIRNANYVGTHFGGSLYAMTDPFYMLMFLQNLGSEYIVWDKAAEINFKKPGLGKVTAEFKINQEDVDSVKKQVEESVRGSILWSRDVHVKNEAGETVTLVNKTLYIKRKEYK